MEKKNKEPGIRVNLYLQDNLYSDYKKVKEYLKDNGTSLSQIMQEYVIRKVEEIK